MKPLEYQRLLYAGHGSLTPAQRLICAYLAHKAYVSRDKWGWVTVTQDDIAHACGVSRFTVTRAVAHLAAQGWIVMVKQVSGGRWTRSKYRLSDPRDHVAESHTDHVAESHTDHVAEVDPSHAGQCHNVVDKGDQDPPPPKGRGPETQRDTPADTTALLDELGIRRRRRA